METCKTCKYWNRNYTIANGVSDCDFVGTITAEKAGTKTLRIDSTVQDDSGLSVVLMTGKDFGCIHHTKKQLI